MHWGTHYWGMHMFWWFFWVAVMVALVFWAWPRARVSRDSALEELRRRYAAGEIDDDEYQHRREVLGAATRKPPGGPGRPSKAGGSATM